jgi:uncharacterized membrane protein YczE
MINLITGLMIGLTLFVFHWFTAYLGTVAIGVAVVLLTMGTLVGWCLYMSFDQWYWRDFK